MKPLRKVMPFLLLALIFSALTNVDKVFGESQVDVVVFVAPNIRIGIEDRLTRYAEDLEAEGWNYLQYNALESEMNENATYFRNLLQDYLQSHDIGGAIFIGDFPTVEWHGGNFNNIAYHPANSDYYYMDLDGNWTSTDEDPGFELHTNETGDLAPEIWVGRIMASRLEGDEAVFINNYLDKNHDYRASGENWGWPRRALAYADNLYLWEHLPPPDPNANLTDYYYDLVANMTACLEKAYSNVTTIYDTRPNGTNTNPTDYMNRLNSTEGYEWVWEVSHGYNIGRHQFQRHQWSGHQWDRFIEYPEVLSSFYLNDCPKAHFFIWETCWAGNFHHDDCLANAALFGNGWGLASIAPTTIAIAQWCFRDFFNKLNQSECIGEAFKAFWNQTVDVDQNQDVHESKIWVILGDPTLRPCPQNYVCRYTKYMQNAKWDSTYWKLLWNNTSTSTSQACWRSGLISVGYLGAKVYRGTTCISGESVVQVGGWLVDQDTMKSTTWDCSLQNVTDTYVKVEIWYKLDGYSWTYMDVAFKTQTFTQNTILNATAWTIYLYGRVYQISPLGPPIQKTCITFYWGSLSKGSRITGMTFTYYG